LAEVEKNGYSLCFMMHPNMRCAMNYFDKNNQVIFIEDDMRYIKVIAESDLLITDYSSVSFDFAYLYKPVIYCQFDKEDFFSGKHSCLRGYFDYENDGFGEVETTLDDTIARVIEYIKNGCTLKDQYSARIDSTFAFNDKNNCERVYNAILNLRNDF
jgi:CDP-glycerol glycerophosphotransferase (TagB/SpsB family)